jgi:hypothetical protein
MRELAESVPGAIERVEAKLPADFEPFVWSSITAGLKRQAEVFLRAVSR